LERIFRKTQLFPLLDKFLLQNFLYPNDALKLVIVDGNVEEKISR
jgi:hypothetical protein